MWTPWYLMPKYKPRKVECEFYNNVVSYCKDKMPFHLGYQYDGSGQARVVMCSKAHPCVRTLFAQCGGLVPLPLNDMEILTQSQMGEHRMWP